MRPPRWRLLLFWVLVLCSPLEIYRPSRRGCAPAALMQARRWGLVAPACLRRRSSGWIGAGGPPDGLVREVTLNELRGCHACVDGVNHTPTFQSRWNRYANLPNSILSNVAH